MTTIIVLINLAKKRGLEVRAFA